MNRAGYSAILILVGMTCFCAEAHGQERHQGINEINLVEDDAFDFQPPRVEPWTLPDQVSLYTLGPPRSDRIIFVGYHHYWIKAVRNHIRRYVRVDRENYDITGVHPALADVRYDQMLSSFNRPPDPDERPTIIGRTTDFFSWGPLRLTSRLRLRMDFKSIYAIAPTDRAPRLRPASLVIPPKPALLSRPRFGFRTSIGSRGLRSIGVKGSFQVRIRRIGFLVEAAARYSLEDDDWRVVVRAIGLAF